MTILFTLFFPDNRSRSLTPLPPKMCPNHTEVIDFPNHNENGTNEFEMVTMLHNNSKHDAIETIVSVNH